jgi:hypothetical protein
MAIMTQEERTEASNAAAAAYTAKQTASDELAALPKAEAELRAAIQKFYDTLPEATAGVDNSDIENAVQAYIADVTAELWNTAGV